MALIVCEGGVRSGRAVKVLSSGFIGEVVRAEVTIEDLNFQK